MKRKLSIMILVAVILTSGCIGFQMNELVKFQDKQERYTYQYRTYLEKASKESSIVNKNHRSPNRVHPLSKEEYMQVVDAINTIEKYNKKSGIHLNRILGQGCVLDDSALQDSVYAETRRDGSSKPLLTPVFVGNNICLDGNIYLNFSSSDYSHTSQLYMNIRKLISKFEKEGNMNDSKLLKFKQELKTYEEKIAFSLESTLVHEEQHTNQRWGNKAAKETDAYNREIDYLKWRLDNVRNPEVFVAGRIKMVEVEQNKTNNAK